MIKTGLSILIINLCFFAFAQSDNYILKQTNPKYSFGTDDSLVWGKFESDITPFSFALNNANVVTDDSILINNESLKSHGIYLELLGREMIYSIGYEYLSARETHAFGYGIGTSFLRLKVLGSIGYNQYSLSSYVFYEYGRVWGVRAAFNVNGKINPIMYSSKLDEVVSADKPPYYVITPSFSLGIFLRPKNSNFHYILNTYLLNAFGKKESFDGGYRWWNVSEYNVWLGLTVKYNLKNYLK